MSQNIYTSTMALSVYNMLSLSGRDMTRAELIGALRAAMSLPGFTDSNITPEYVNEGAAYLLARRFVSQDAAGRLVIAMRDAKTQRGPRLKRVNFDKDLARAS